jgi:hypothetical protein
LRVVGVFSLQLVQRSEFAAEATERVVDALLRLAELVGGVTEVFPDAVAGGVEGVGQGVAEGVGDLREAVCGVVGVVEGAAVGQREARELAGGVVGVGGLFVADGLADEAAAQVVGEDGDEAVRVDQAARPAVQVVSRDPDEVTQGVFNCREVAAFTGVGVGCVVVAVGGEVADVGPRSVGSDHLAKGVVGEGPGARAADRGGGEAEAAIAVGGGLFAAAEEVAGGVVAKNGALEGFGDAQRQAVAGVPFVADGAGFGMAGGFDTSGLEVSGQVVGVGREPAVEVGAAGDVAVGVVGEAAGEAGDERLADRRHAVRAEQVVEGVFRNGAQGVGDVAAGNSAGSVFPVGDGMAIDATGVLAACGEGTGVVGPGRVGVGVFVCEASEQGWFDVAADVDAGVAVAAHVSVGGSDGGEVAVAIVGVRNSLASGCGEFPEEILGVVGEGEAAAKVVLDAGESVGAGHVAVAERKSPAFNAGEAPAGGIEGFDGVVAFAPSPAGGGLLQLADDVGVGDPVGGAAGLGTEVENPAIVAEQEDEVGTCRGVEQDVVVVSPAVAQRALGGASVMIGALTVIVALEGQR